MTDNQSQYTI